MPLQPFPSIRIRQSCDVVQESEFRSYVKQQGLLQDPPMEINLPYLLTPEIITANGGDPVLEAPAPTVTAFQSAVRNGVTQDALGNWVYAWIVCDWTQEEIDQSIAQQKRAIQNQIDQLERDSMMNRGVRELSMRIMEQQADTMAQQQGITVAEVLAGVPAYVKFKALDDQISALRAQL